jgi:hypothetical protein
MAVTVKFVRKTDLETIVGMIANAPTLFTRAAYKEVKAMLRGEGFNNGNIVRDDEGLFVSSEWAHPDYPENPIRVTYRIEEYVNDKGYPVNRTQLAI